MPHENIDIVRAALRALNEQDLDTLLEVWAPDGEWQPAFTGGGILEGTVYRGHEGVANYLHAQRETWETIIVDPLAFQTAGNRVLANIRVSAVGRGSGVPVDQVTWNVFEIGGGKVTAGRVYTTEKEALEALRRGL